MIGYIFGGIVVLAIIVGIIYSILNKNKIRKNGIEADAVVCRIEESTSYDEETGTSSTTYRYFVKYTTKTGETVEARLADPPRTAVEGTQLRIKYLPEKPKFVIMAKK
ncbi:MAG: DUF3592 domain-containing protein [Clostridia bacterium]|nr:DUF3592 domain-containing protein [Clostridia bacterium]